MLLILSTSFLRVDPLTFISPDSPLHKQFIGEVSWFKELIPCSSEFSKLPEVIFGLLNFAFNFNYSKNYLSLGLAIATICSSYM